ncbi:hypothetical protein C8R46DRAFT_1070739 [Mycena filopes]|nr:hypothetical protein C8R46DRAFT_1070739 [Mycena filopes]
MSIWGNTLDSWSALKHRWKTMCLVRLHSQSCRIDVAVTAASADSTGVRWPFSGYTQGSSKPVLLQLLAPPRLSAVPLGVCDLGYYTAFSADNVHSAHHLYRLLVSTCATLFASRLPRPSRTVCAATLVSKLSLSMIVANMDTCGIMGWQSRASRISCRPLFASYHNASSASLPFTATLPAPLNICSWLSVWPAPLGDPI